MSEFRFYAPNGMPITKKQFIELYSQIYWYLNRDLEFERKIEKILKSDRLTSENIMDILAWKVGATSRNNKNKTVTYQWRTIDASELIKEIKGKSKLIVMQKRC